MKKFLELVEKLEPLGLLALAGTLGVRVVRDKSDGPKGGTETGDLDLRCGDPFVYRTSSDDKKALRDARPSVGAHTEPAADPSQNEGSAAFRDGLEVISDIAAAYSKLNRSERRKLNADLAKLIKRQGNKQ